MPHREFPFLRICLPLCAGIISGLYFSPSRIILLSSAIIIIAGFIASLFFNRFITNRVYGIFFFLALYFCGLLLYTNEKNSLSELDPAESLYSVTLSDYPEERENSFRMTVELGHKIVNGTGQNLNGSVMLYNKKEPLISSLVPGDRLLMKITPVEITSRGNPDEFDYRFYMETQHIKYYAFTDSHDIISQIKPEKRRLIHRALITREKIIGMYRERGISGDTLALVAAITLGQKNMLDPEQKQHFIKAGVMHIMAVSGLHAVILSLFIFNILFFLKKRFNIVRVTLTILFLWAFAFVTGLTPSVLRATLMFTFLQAGNIMRRPVNGINSVMASAFVLILIKPSVIFEAGFLLSYSAVIFIISFYRDLYFRIQLKHRLPDLVWQSAAVTLVAQAGTLPLTIMLFNRFPTWFLLSNIIIVPLSSIVVITGCLVPLLFPVAFISQILAKMLGFLAGLTEWLTEMASSMPLSTIENIGMTPWECILLYLVIFLSAVFLLRRGKLSVHYPLIALLLFILAGTVKSIPLKRSGEIIVFNTPGLSTIGIRTGDMLTLFSEVDTISPDVVKHAAVRHLKLKQVRLTSGCSNIQINNKTILVTDFLNLTLLNTYNPDIVILTGLYPKIDRALVFSNPVQDLVITSEVSAGYRLPERPGSGRADHVYYVRNSGAFRSKL